MWATRKENINYSKHNMMGPKKTYATGRKLTNSKWSSIYPQIIELLSLGTKPIDIANKLGIQKNSIYEMIKLAKRRNN
jgi:transposase-like protein